MTRRDLVVFSIGAAIFLMEGTHGKKNNPGNLREGIGQLRVENGFAVFADMLAGWKALYHQVELNIDRKLTLYEFFAGKPGVYDGYAPSADKNNPKRYAESVAHYTGINPSVVILDFIGGAA